MGNSGNQIRNKMIQGNPKTDGQKLAGLEKFLHRMYPDCSVIVEPHLIFTKGEDEFQSWESYLDQETVEKFNTHPADLLLRLPAGNFIVLELDGPIHDTKRTEKTAKRNKLYELNNIPYVVVNEADLKFELQMPKTRPLTQDQINDAFYEKINKISIR